MKNIFHKKETLEIYGCDHVQQEWLSKLSWKLQTVINQGLRAPDTHYCRAMKIVCRWMRMVVLQNADEKHTFMCKKKELPTVEDIENEINYCTVHCATHFLYALEIIGYYHSDENIKQIAMNYYRGIVQELWHFKIESYNELEIRLSDVDRKPKTKPCPTKEENDSYLKRFNG